MTLPIVDICVLIVEAVSFILYFLVTIFMIQNSKTSQTFHSSFTIHFIANGIYGFTSFLLFIIFRYLPSWNTFTDFYLTNQWLTIFYSFTMYQFETLLITGNVILTVNKFFAICHPVFYKIYWTKSVSYIIIFFQFIMIYLFYCHLYFVGGTFVNNSDKTYFTKPKWIYSLWDGIVFCFVCWFSTIIMFILTTKIVLKFNKFIAKNNEFNFLTKFQAFLQISLTNLIHFSLSIITSISIYSIVIENRESKNRMNHNVSRILPLLACSAPYCLILSTKNFRVNFGHFVTCGFLNNNPKNVIVTMYFGKKNVVIGKSII